MIQDYTWVAGMGVDLQCSAPSAGNLFDSSFGIDLNPDFGQGQQARKSPLIGMGHELLFRIDVDVGFAQGGTAVPIYQIHAALSSAGNGVKITSGSNIIIIGTVTPSVHSFAQDPAIVVGLHIDQLAFGSRFFLRLNPWTNPMGRNVAGGAVIGKDLRYLGLIITQTNYHTASCFGTGIVRGKLVTQGDVMDQPSDYVYPSATTII